MAGNVGVLKHAIHVPGCAMAIESVFRDAGFGQGVFTTLLTDNDGAADVIRHDVIQAVTLTGSTRAGKSVAASAGSVLKKTVLELGGSYPFIVLADAWAKAHPSGPPPALDGNLLNYVDAPNRYGLPAFYEIHVWAWERNPQGSYADWNTHVTCVHQPG